MQVNLLVTSSDDRVVNKAYSLVATSTCVVKGDSSIFRPTVELANIGDEYISRINYFYIPAWHRYYFVTNITVLTGGRFLLEGKCDVLMSYKNSILSTSAIVTRNEFEFNEDMDDDKVTAWKGRKYYYEEIAELETVDNYYITVV